MKKNHKKLNFLDIDKMYYFSGIGGVNMSALANILYHKGYKVSGSDIRESKLTEDLERKGICVNYRQVKKNINDDYIIIKTDAVSDGNEEIIEAKKKNLTIIGRAEFLDALSKDKHKSIAISGTHGKTTTTSILSHLMIKLGFDPTCLVGGEIDAWNGTYRIGNGDYFVYEACEAFNNFRYYNPNYLIVTSIDMDHTDVFKNIEEVKSYFIEYINRVADKGMAILNIDDENIRGIRDKLRGNIKYYSVLSDDIETSSLSDYSTVKHSSISDDGSPYSVFDTCFKDVSYSFKIPLTGIYNIQNSLSAISLVYEIMSDKLDFLENVNHAFSDFINAKRRFEYIGIYKGAYFYNDYSHHPKEVSVMLDNAIGYKKSEASKIISIFQPHLYSRTQEFYIDFASALSKSDIVILTPIYPAREEPIKGVSSEIIYDELTKTKPSDDVYLVSDSLASIDVLNSIVSQYDLILTIGAGDIGDLHKSIEII